MFLMRMRDRNLLFPAFIFSFSERFGTYNDSFGSYEYYIDKTIMLRQIRTKESSLSRVIQYLALSQTGPEDSDVRSRILKLDYRVSLNR